MNYISSPSTNCIHTLWDEYSNIDNVVVHNMTSSSSSNSSSNDDENEIILYVIKIVCDCSIALKFLYFSLYF